MQKNHALTHCDGLRQVTQQLWRTLWPHVTKLNMELLRHPGVVLPEFIPWNENLCSHEHLHTGVPTVALPLTFKTENHPGVLPQVDGYAATVNPQHGVQAHKRKGHAPATGKDPRRTEHKPRAPEPSCPLSPHLGLDGPEQTLVSFLAAQGCNPGMTLDSLKCMDEKTEGLVKNLTFVPT